MIYVGSRLELTHEAQARHKELLAEAERERLVRAFGVPTMRAVAASWLRKTARFMRAVARRVDDGSARPSGVVASVAK
ncbi:MAG: hypothetical protein NZ518_01055 [Dehalococcoidia bacterium]|nr:hypothetical protein [Dehalococcoidia bacterium]